MRKVLKVNAGRREERKAARRNAQCAGKMSVVDAECQVDAPPNQAMSEV